MKRKEFSPCSIFVSTALIGIGLFLIYKVVRFFQSPRAMESLLEMLKALGICLGVVIACIFIFVLIAIFSAKDRKAKLASMSKSYMVRCWLTDNTTIHSADVRAQNAAESKPAHPVYLLFSLTNYGVCLTPIQPQPALHWIDADNEIHYQAISMGRTGAIILPMGFFYLYYIRYRQSRPINFEMLPSGQPGIYGALPPDLGGDQVEIVLTSTAILDVAEVDKVIYREHQVIIKGSVMSDNGDEEPAATRELYTAIFDFINRANTSYDDYY